jgi:cell division protein FtsB
MIEKNQMLDEFSSIERDKKALDSKFLLNFFLVMTFVFVVLFPKMFLQHEIYYKSREIEKLKREYDSLKEENEIINFKVESLKYKNQVADTNF